MSEEKQPPPKSKVKILDERSYQLMECPPPNFVAWFICEKRWNFRVGEENV